MISVLSSLYFSLMLSLYFISHEVTCITSFNSKYPRLHTATANWLLRHMSRFVVVFMFVTIDSIKTKCLYREACVDAASTGQYVTFSPPFSFVFACDTFSLCCWHIIVRISMEGGTVSSPSVGTSATCHPSQ